MITTPVWSGRNLHRDAVPIQTTYAGQRLIMLTDGHSLVHREAGGLTNWVLDLLSLWSEKLY